MNLHRNGSAKEVVVVTGASAGVGRATARHFARHGAAVALIARGAAALEETKAEMEAVGAKSIAIPADVSDAAAMLAAAREVEEKLGPIDIWINNAMVTVFAPVHDTKPEEFHRVTEVTYLGCVYGTMAALNHMRSRDRGVIVQIGSALAYRSIPLQAAYCGAKHAIRGFTDSLRSELLHERSNIEVVMVQLPAVNTPQFEWARTHLDHEPRPVPPVMQPEAVAEVIFDTAHRPSREVWIGTSTFKAILGNILAPAFLDRYLARHGYDEQQTERSVPADRKDNLMTPVKALHRTRGAFGGEAQEFAPALSGRTARLGIGVLLVGVISIGTWLVAARRAVPRALAVSRPGRHSRLRSASRKH